MLPVSHTDPLFPLLVALGAIVLLLLVHGVAAAVHAARARSVVRPRKVARR